MSKVQKDFFNAAIGQNLAISRGVELYQELVYHRFDEVLSNANPIFHSLINPKKFQKLVQRFMLHGAKSEFIWQAPNEFRKFIKKDTNLTKKMPFINDLLWFEWIEVELFMQDYSDFTCNAFTFSSSYKFSKNARIKKLKHEVVTKTFEKKSHYLIAFYDLDDKEVYFKEISKFMYEFIKLQKDLNAKEALKHISKKYTIKAKEIKADIKNASKELCALGILQKRTKK